MSWKRRAAMFGLLPTVLLVLVAALLGRSILFPPAPPRKADSARQSSATQGSDEQAGRTYSGPTPKVDFSGRWELDLAASDSLDEVLKACGVSAIERMFVNTAAVTQVITQTDQEVTIDVISGFYKRTDILLLDGRKTPGVDPAGRAVESASSWNADGTAIVTSVWLQPGQPPLEMTRTLEDSQTMYVVDEYAPADGPRLTCRRIYRRIGETSPAK
jgi:hypothetical protein